MAKKRRTYTKARIQFETRAKNIEWHRAMQMTQARANLRMERDRLHGLLHSSINPGLKEKMFEARNEISSILGD